MEGVLKTISVKASISKAFDKFIRELNEWWPKEYTWSRDTLQDITIDGKENGLCSETGPFGFRIDWGRVTHMTRNEKIAMKWQVSPQREPVPDPQKASDLKVEFSRQDDTILVRLQHLNFENHGYGAEEYRDLMNSQQGWDYILDSYKRYCEKD